MPRPETFTRRRTVVVTIALRSEMNNFLLAALAALDHHLLALRRATTRFIAGHVLLAGHPLITCGVGKG